MASIFFPLGPAKMADIVNLVDAAAKPASVVSADPFLFGQSALSETVPPVIVMQTLKALGAGGGTRTPTTFVTGT
jgi:hypothetical protein